VTYGELVVFALGRIGKTADAVRASEIGEFIFSSGDDFVGVTLMADVPEKLVGLKIENTMQCQRQFHYAEITCQMPAGLADRIQDKTADFIG
jgi:hypothetical protein